MTFFQDVKKMFQYRTFPDRCIKELKLLNLWRVQLREKIYGRITFARDTRRRECEN